MTGASLRAQVPANNFMLSIAQSHTRDAQSVCLVQIYSSGDQIAVHRAADGGCTVWHAPSQVSRPLFLALDAAAIASATSC